MILKLRDHIAFITILIFYLVLFIPFLGNVHLFDWDEINFAEAAREMLVTGDWLNVQINYEPFWEKPPLFIWLQAISMKVFGITEFAARFPNVLAGLASLILLYSIVLKRYGKQAAVFTLFLYIGSITPHFYFKSGIIDPVFNLFIFTGILFLVKSIETSEMSNFFWSGLFLGLAVLTKGPVAILITGLVGLVYQVVYGSSFYSIKSLVLLMAGLSLVPGAYFGIQIYQSGLWFLQEFVVYNIDLFRYPIASHGQPFYYHIVVLLIGCFPLFIFVIDSMFTRKSLQNDSTFYRWMKVLFWVVLILFSLVTTKIVHYSSLCYIPLAIVGGTWLSDFSKLKIFPKILFGIVGLIWTFILLAAGAFALNEDKIISFLKRNINDDFVRSQLAAEVEWSIVPIFLAILLIGSALSVIIRPSKISISRFLVTNTLVIALLMISIIPNVEKKVQGDWISHLKTYQGKEIAHFTLGFKSYAHKYYTHQQQIVEYDLAKKTIINNLGYESIYDLNQTEKSHFETILRNYVLRQTNIPISVSAKIQKFDELNTQYPDLKQVFEGNGYGVWERK
ncbi:glycosyltransferase family 39 protein [Bacteroidia bacterium]|nr:glycosyltransferase family 39 protein [Bacteroidia bacterium]MDC1395035.1 glycosyltransferase family 39 protein [Bacteroidia bacterium]